MKVLHISTSDSGGAGIAALRTHIALLESGVKSKFLCLYKSSTSVPEVYQYRTSGISSIKKNILNRFGIKLPNSVLNKRKVKGLRGEYEAFSFPRTDIALHHHFLVKEADIINLHWVANFIDYPSFFSNLKKPVVWTLHDMNPFQGGFHYSKDRENNMNVWGDLESEFENLKVESVKKLSTLHVVTPSKWLGEATKNSKVFSNRPVHESFFYGIDFEVFKPLRKEVACEALGIPVEGIKIFFAADSLLNKRKGFDLLLAALLSLKNHQDINLVTIGHTTDNQLQSNFKCYNLGTLKDAKLINIAYNVADCFVLPSIEDNMPNVMLEALACGLPIISFPVGGMAEVIKTGDNGILAKALSSECLAEAIQGFIDNKFIFQRNEIRDTAFRMFNMKQHADKYIGLYSQIKS
ncbi:glycosyltransferase [Pontibacter saemangeumensis]|uniref:Glycosyltransferase n=1 Tax=Pontibacter saemangeumensis TaxID=1084525 RepID=A0ABP8LDB6_9BACT